MIAVTADTTFHYARVRTDSSTLHIIPDNQYDQAVCGTLIPPRWQEEMPEPAESFTICPHCNVATWLQALRTIASGEQRGSAQMTALLALRLTGVNGDRMHPRAAP